MSATAPGTDDGCIDMVALLADAARAHGLDPTTPPPATDPLVQQLIRRVGPMLIHPERSPAELLWVAAGLDALSNAAQIAATGTHPGRWRYELTGDRVRLYGALLTAGHHTVGVRADHLPHLMFLLGQVAGDPAHRGWWRANTATAPGYAWSLAMRQGVVWAHHPTADLPAFPLSPDDWRETDVITLEFLAFAHLARVMASGAAQGGEDVT